MAFATAGRPALAAEVGDVIRWQDVVTFNGRTITAQQLNRETVIVQFWASWCPFCAKQNPHIEALHRSANGRYRVLTVSIDKQRDEALNYLHGKGYTFDAAWQPETRAGVPGPFGVRKGLPVVYVVRPGGKVVFKEAGEMFAEDVLGLSKWAE
jgi:thiol-disulfide isomerase/thioredoxin